MPIAIEWDVIEPTGDAWSQVLARLLSAAREAATLSPHERGDIIDALSAFIAYSPAGVSSSLDAMARLTVDELLTATAEDLLRSIDGRSAALETLQGELKSGRTSR